MKYLSFVRADGMPSSEALAVMQRELPGWAEEMDRRGVRLFGRELDLPDTAVTVRVRDGETLVTDGPFAETKEFVAGFDLTECADLDEAIEVAAKCPVSWFQALEIRPFTDGLRLGEKAVAFGRGEDGGVSPYLLSMWISQTPAAPLDDQAVMHEGETWRQDVEARGLHLLGDPAGGTGHGHYGPRPRQSDAAPRRTVQRNRGFHRRHRGRQLPQPAAGDSTRGRPPDRLLPRDRGAPVLQRMTPIRSPRGDKRGAGYSAAEGDPGARGVEP
jgi:hypothetical protein